MSQNEETAMNDRAIIRIVSALAMKPKYVHLPVSIITDIVRETIERME